MNLDYIIPIILFVGVACVIVFLIRLDDRIRYVQKKDGYWYVQYYDEGWRAHASLHPTADVKKYVTLEEAQTAYQAYLGRLDRLNKEREHRNEMAEVVTVVKHIRKK